jgi:hypothetical protein
MTTSPTGSPTQQRTLDERVPLRLSLDPGPRSGPLDGAWWPQSRDLQREGADLVDHFPREVGRVERLLFSRPDWDAGSEEPNLHRVQAARGPVKAGSFPGDDTHVMVVQVSSGPRLRLLVIPSATAPEVAARLLQRAADGDNTSSPGTLLEVTPD